METKEHQGLRAEGHGQGHKGQNAQERRSVSAPGGWRVCVAQWWATLGGRAGTWDGGSCHQEKYILYLKGKGTYLGFLLKIFLKCTEGIFFL